MELQKTADYYKMFKEHIQADFRCDDEEEEGEEDFAKDPNQQRFDFRPTTNNNNEEDEVEEDLSGYMKTLGDDDEEEEDVSDRRKSKEAADSDGLGQTQLSEIEETYKESSVQPPANPRSLMMNAAIDSQGISRLLKQHS